MFHVPIVLHFVKYIILYTCILLEAVKIQNSFLSNRMSLTNRHTHLTFLLSSRQPRQTFVLRGQLCLVCLLIKHRKPNSVLDLFSQLYSNVLPQIIHIFLSVFVSWVKLDPRTTGELKCSEYSILGSFD